MKYIHLIFISILIPCISQTMKIKNNDSVTINFNGAMTKIVNVQMKPKIIRKQRPTNYELISQLKPRANSFDRA